jgi:O-methyltransferase
MNAIYNQISHSVYSTAETQRQSYEIGDYLRNNSIEGDVVELGIAAGGNFATMLLGCREAGLNKKGWGFDSFQGIQLAGKKDTSQPGIGEITHNVDVPDEELLVSSGVTVHPKQNVIDNLTNWGLYNNVELVEGWVQHTLPVYADKIEKIAVLRLDMDIYYPTKIALEYLFEKVVKGGVVVIDDWALDGARLACEEYFKKIKYKPNYIGVPNSTPVYFYK